MPEQMHAAVIEDFGKPLVVKDVAIPVPGIGQILVKTEACGVCHTDLHAARGDCQSNRHHRLSLAMRLSGP